MNTKHLNVSHVGNFCLFLHSAVYSIQEASGQFVSWHHKCVFMVYFIKRHACFKKQSAAAAAARRDLP